MFKSSKTTQPDKFKNLSSEVLCHHLQNPNLVITGNHARMLEMLGLATNSAPAEPSNTAPEVPFTMDKFTKTNLQTYVNNCICNLMSLQNRLIWRPTVLILIGS